MKKKTKVINESLKWYKENRDLYIRLAKRVENIIKDILEAEKIPFHTVNSRAKELDSFEKKASNDKYADPTNEIKDFAGIRVITYVESDVRKICDIVEKNFNIDKEHYNDKSTNKFGYRSIHYVASLPDSRVDFPELRIYRGLFFEVQVRTILQHAWAEIEHDRNYKLHGVLPEQNDIKNRFAVLSGILKMVDTEFDSIVTDIDQYISHVETDTKEGKLNILIDSISLKEFMTNKFTNQIEYAGLVPTFGHNSGNGGEVIISELKNFGIETLEQLDSIIPEDFSIKATKECQDSNFIGILRTIMIINDINKYFERSWNRGWTSTDIDSIATLNNYKVDYQSVFQKYDIDIFSRNDEFYEFDEEIEEET